MSSRHALCAALAAIALIPFAPKVAAQTVSTDPVGFLNDSIPATSDATVTAPLTRAPVFQGTISSISGTTISVVGTPNWQSTSPKQFEHIAGSQPNTYYAQIGNGTKAGQYVTITDNGAASIVVQTNPSDDLTGIATEATAGAGNGAKIVIFPYWTPATLFPASWPAGTQVFLFDDSTAGVNHSASQILFYSGTKWFDSGNNQDSSDLLIHPIDAFIVRNNSANPISRIVLGSVPLIHHRVVISTLAANVPQDVHIAYSSPAPQVIGNSSLGFSAGDQLFVFDNTAAGENKSASQILFYNNGSWYDAGNNANVTTTFSLQPGRGYIFRKNATATPQDFVWQSTQSYNP